MSNLILCIESLFSNTADLSETKSLDMLVDSALANQKSYETQTNYKIESVPKEKKKWFDLKSLWKNSKSHLFKKRKFLRVSFYRNNTQFFSTILFYVIAQIALIILQVCLYANVNNYVKVARVCGILLNLNSCLVILLVI